MESILTSIKKLLGSTEDYEHFDPDIIVFANGIFSVLNQLGVGPEEGFAIVDKNDTWDEYTSDQKILNMVKPYITLKVKLAFDPPSSSAVMKSYEETIREYEWRLNVAAESS